MATFRRRGLLLTPLLLAGCQNQDAEQLARLGAKLSEKTEALLIGSSGPLTQTWPSLPVQFGDLSLDARVASRLRWDKRLADLNLRVKADGNTVELHGQVKELEQRRRAVELAETTAGVEKVADKLEGPE
jgi:osmotically-inducible protein OsmY